MIIILQFLKISIFLEKRNKKKTIAYICQCDLLQYIKVLKRSNMC